MADFEALNLTISAESSNASGSINSLVQSLHTLQSTLSSINTSQITQTLQGLSRLVNGITAATSSFGANSGFANGIVQGITNIASAIDAISDDTIGRVERLSGALNTLSTVAGNMPNVEIQVPNISGVRGNGGRGGRSGAGGASSFLGAYAGAFTETVQSFSKRAGGMLKVAGQGAASSMRVLAGAMRELYKGFGLGHISSMQFLRDLGRIAKYRILRSMIKAFTSGVVTGLQNLAHYSTEANAALSQLSTGSLYLKNSLGAALYPAIASLICIFNTLIGVIVRALNVINMLFSVLGGKGTYIRATKQTKDFTKATGAAGGAAKALKQELMGFDEINALSPDGGGGGGGGGGMLDYGGMFEEAPVEDWVKQMVDTGDFSPLGEKIADKVNAALEKINWIDVREGAKSVANAISSALNGFIGKIDAHLVGKAIAGVINAGSTLVSEFWANTNWEQLGEKVKTALVTALDELDAETLGKAIVGKFKAMIRFLNGWLRGEGGSFLGKLGTKIGEVINSAVAELDGVELANALVGIIQGAADGAVNLINTVDFDTLATEVLNFVSTAIKGIPFGTISSAIAAIINRAALFFTLPETQLVMRNVTKQVADFLISCIKKIKWDEVGKALAGIANALVSGVSDALSEGKSSDQKGIIISTIEGFFNEIDVSAVVNLIDLGVNTSVGKAILLFSLVKALSTTIGAKSFRNTMIFALPALLSIVASFNELKTAITNGDSLLTAVAKLVGQVLFGAAGAFLGWYVGGPMGAALGFSIGVLLSAKIEEIDAEYGPGSLKYQSKYNKESIEKQLRERLPAIKSSVGDTDEYIRQLTMSLSALSGVQFSSDSTLAVLDRVMPGLSAKLGNGTASMQEMEDAVDLLFAEMLSNVNSGAWADYVAQLGLVNSAASDASGTLTTAASDISGTTDIISANAGNLYQTISDASAAADELSESTDDLPTVIMIDGSSMDGVKDSAVEASNAVGGLSTFLTMIQRAFRNFTGSFTPLAESANSANTSAETLRDTIREIPTAKSTTLSTLNADVAKRSIDKVKKALNGIHDKTINIRIKAGLTAGAKSFLNELKNAADATTQTSISNLLKFSQFAQGGFPKSGELFMANENGRQELVGRIGSQPAVANQDQIGDAIFRYMDAHSAQRGGGFTADELASAIVRGMKAAGLGTARIGVKQVTTAINQETQRSGKPAIQF